MKRITQVSVLAAALLAGGAGLTAVYAHGFGPGGGFGHGGPGWGGPFAGRHIDGTVAFLKAELAITPQQEPQWRAVEAALRAGAERMKQVRASFGRDRDNDGRRDALAAPERLARMEAASAAALESVRSIRTAFEPLYASMSDEQKKRADELMQRRRR